MSTATASRKRRGQEAQNEVMRLQAKFGNFNGGDAVASISATVIKDALNPLVAEEVLCGKRLKVRVVLGSGGNPAQQEFWTDIRHDVRGTVDVKKYSSSPKKWSFTLAFALSEIDAAELLKFSRQEGCLVIEEVANMPVRGDGSSSDDDDEDEDDTESQED